MLFSVTITLGLVHCVVVISDSLQDKLYFKYFAPGESGGFNG